MSFCHLEKGTSKIPNASHHNLIFWVSKTCDLSFFKRAGQPKKVGFVESLNYAFLRCFIGVWLNLYNSSN